VREEARLEAGARASTGWLASGDLDLGDDAESDEVFSRFMSDEIDDEPSREWVIGHPA
jgi:hypothetical protein